VLRLCRVALFYKSLGGAVAILRDDTESFGLGVVLVRDVQLFGGERERERKRLSQLYRACAKGVDPFRRREMSEVRGRRRGIRLYRTANQEHSEDISLRMVSLYPTSKSRHHSIVVSLES